MPLSEAERAEARAGLRLALSVLQREPTAAEAALLNPPRSGAVLTPSEPAAGGKVDEATYAKMSHGERLDYCRKFPQPRPGGGG